MAEHKPINWAYPFPSKDTSHNPLQLLTHMAQAKGGFYPTGENGLWHGGVHFDEGTAAAFDQSSVRCIADGEVIAYRIDDTLPGQRIHRRHSACQKSALFHGVCAGQAQPAAAASEER